MSNIITFSCEYEYISYKINIVISTTTVMSVFGRNITKFHILGNYLK